MITLSRPINWAYYYYGWRNSGLSFLAFCERVFEQTHPPISKAEVIAGFMLQHGADQPERIRNRTGPAQQANLGIIGSPGFQCRSNHHVCQMSDDGAAG